MDSVRSSLRFRSSTTAALALMFAGALGCCVALPAQMLGDGTASQAPIERYPAPPPQASPQQTRAYSAPAPQGYAAPAAAGVGSGGVLPFESVMSSSFSKMAFTFDRSMLQVADGFFAGGDAETKRVVAGLNSITVHNYRARDFARYDAGALATIDAQYRALGWKHLVNANSKDGTSLTDLWLHFEGPNISGLTVLTRGDRNMNVINVDCMLRPLDLLHLGGHFGIPKVDESAVMVPAR